MKMKFVSPVPLCQYCHARCRVSTSVTWVWEKNEKSVFEGMVRRENEINCTKGRQGEHVFCFQVGHHKDCMVLSVSSLGKKKTDSFIFVLVVHMK